MIWKSFSIQFVYGEKQTLPSIFGIFTFPEYLFMLKKIYIAKSHNKKSSVLLWEYKLEGGKIQTAQSYSIFLPLISLKISFN